MICRLCYHYQMVSVHLSASHLYTYAGTLEHAFGGGHGVDVVMRVLTRNFRISGETFVDRRCHRNLTTHRCLVCITPSWRPGDLSVVSAGERRGARLLNDWSVTNWSWSTNRQLVRSVWIET